MRSVENSGRERRDLVISIRPEVSHDLAAIHALNERAFGQSEEANIVDRLRKSCEDVLSLVATTDDMIVGHSLFSPVTIEEDGRTTEGMGLAPMAVLPEYQRREIGTALVKKGLSVLRSRSCPFVIVLGHPEYYPRFGFEPASKRGIRCQWEGVPDEVFLILVLDGVTMKGVSGIARYRPEFDPAAARARADTNQRAASRRLSRTLRGSRYPCRAT
jgi:putative acetyltransferase